MVGFVLVIGSECHEDLTKQLVLMKLAALMEPVFSNRV